MAQESKENKIIKDLSGFVFCNEDLRNPFVEMINLLGEINSGKRTFKADKKIPYEEILKLLETAAINAKLENKKRPSFNKVEIGGIKPYPKFNFDAFAGEAGPSYCGITTVLDESGNLFVDIPSVVKTLTEITTFNLDEEGIHTLNNVEQASLSSTIKELKEFIQHEITDDGDKTRKIIAEESSITRAVTIEEAERNRTLLSHEIADLKYQIINISNQLENTDANKNKKEVIRLQNEMSDMETRYSALIVDKKILEKRYSQLSHEKEQLEKERNKKDEKNKKFYALEKKKKTYEPRCEREGNYLWASISTFVIEIILALLSIAMYIISFVNEPIVLANNPTWETALIVMGSCYLILTVCASICIIIYDGNWIRRDNNKWYLIAVLAASSIACALEILSFAEVIPGYFIWIGFVICILVLIGNLLYFIHVMNHCVEDFLVVVLIGMVSLFAISPISQRIGNKISYNEYFEEKYSQYEGISDDLILYRTLEDGTLAVAVYQFGSEELVIPSQIDGKVVTVFEGSGWYFVNNWKTVKKITIPDSVISIGDLAFSHCTGLISITIPDSVTDIGEAFNDCSAEIIWGENPTITQIGKDTFYGYEGTSITIPDSVTKIGEYAFADCGAEIIWGENPTITQIGENAFYGYEGTSITIPDIGEGAFKYCSAEIIWGENPTITQIGDDAFYEYEGTSITIPDSVTDIGKWAFSYSRNLTEVTFENTHGWQVSQWSNFSGYTGLSSSNLADGTIAAKYLKDTYDSYYWRRVE